MLSLLATSYTPGTIDVNLLTKATGCTALWGACAAGNLEGCRILFGRGADITVTDDNGVSPRMIADIRGRSKVVDWVDDVALESNGNNNEDEDEGLQMLGIWTCKTCGLRNEPSKWKCNVCGRPNVSLGEKEVTAKMEEEKILRSMEGLDVEEEEEKAAGVSQVEEKKDEDEVILDEEKDNRVNTDETPEQKKKRKQKEKKMAKIAQREKEDEEIRNRPVSNSKMFRSPTLHKNALFKKNSPKPEERTLQKVGSSSLTSFVDFDE